MVYVVFTFCYSLFISLPIKYLCRVCMKQWHTCNYVVLSSQYWVLKDISYFDRNILLNDAVQSLSLFTALTESQLSIKISRLSDNVGVRLIVVLSWKISPNFHLRSVHTLVHTAILQKYNLRHISHSLFNIDVCLSIYHHADCVWYSNGWLLCAGRWKIITQFSFVMWYCASIRSVHNGMQRTTISVSTQYCIYLFPPAILHSYRRRKMSAR